MAATGGATIHLLRHGETAAAPAHRAGRTSEAGRPFPSVGGARYCGRTDVALTDNGWRQMWSAVETAGAWRAVVSSPLARCRVFAERLAERRGIPVTLDERLVELDFGEWEGRRVAALMRACPEALARFWQDPLAHPPPGGETIAALSGRVLGAWRDIRARGEPVLVVSHAGPIRVILAHLAGRPLAHLPAIHVPHAVLLPVAAGRPAPLPPA
jgi:broad specificity phosphatase PhoE